MKSSPTARFRPLLTDQPKAVQKQANSTYRLFRDDPFRKSLRFKEVSPDESVWSARVGIGYRVLGVRSEDEIVWFWIGSHSDYENLI